MGLRIMGNWVGSRASRRRPLDTHGSPPLRGSRPASWRTAAMADSSTLLPPKTNTTAAMYYSSTPPSAQDQHLQDSLPARLSVLVGLSYRATTSELADDSSRGSLSAVPRRRMWVGWIS
jgi:hypothetical protein